MVATVVRKVRVLVECNVEILDLPPEYIPEQVLQVVKGAVGDMADGVQIINATALAEPVFVDTEHEVHNMVCGKCFEGAQINLSMSHR